MEALDWMNIGGIVVFVLALAPLLYFIFGQSND
jgi:uncharacterized membrane protein YukC